MNHRPSPSDEEFVEDLISQLPPTVPSARLQRLVAQIPVSHPHESFSWWPFGGLWQPVLAMISAATLGLFVGQSWQDLREENAPSAALVQPSSPEEDDTTALTDAVAEGESSETASSEGVLDDLLVFASVGAMGQNSWDYLGENTVGAQLDAETAQ